MDWLTGLLSIGINISYDSGNRSAPASAGEHGGPSDEQLRAAERQRRTAVYRSAANAGSKYKPNAEDKELIGVTDAILFWASESGVDNSTDDAGNSGLHLTLFDTATRADSAQIKLLNDSGSTQYVVAAAIKAKPVIRMSGDQGFTHDAFIDYQDIFLNGENSYEFGNNFVVTKAQLEQLADYYAKALGTIATSGAKAKHIYAVSIPGRCWWFEPGEWYTLQVGGAGQREYIDSVVECYDVTVDAAADSLGTTNIAFREVEQNWVKDSNAVARFLATGDPKWKSDNFEYITVAAYDNFGTADYYCDGTADQTEIQAAIDFMASAYGKGLVRLTPGTYHITAAIEGNSNITLYVPAGATLEKNCNDYLIECVGTGGARKSGFVISGDGSFTKNAADTNNIACLYYDYADDCKVEGITFDGFKYVILEATQNCNAIVFTNKNIIKNSSFSATAYDLIQISSTCRVSGNHFHDNKNLGWTINVPIAAAMMSAIEGNHLKNNYGSGIISAGDGSQVLSNYVEECAQYRPAPAILVGISSNGTGNIVTGNRLLDNGSLIDYGICESVNPPAAIDEASNTLTQCTYARSDVQEYEGSYSYLLTKTVAAGTAATAYLTDNANTNDLHGLYASQEYRFGAWVYIPSAGMLGSELTLVIRDYVAAWEETAVACATTYDAWQYVEVTKTLRAGSIGATFGFAIASAAANAETAYTDNLRLTPMGTGNLHNQNFYDAGTSTYTGV